MRLFMLRVTGHTGVQIIDLAVVRSHAVAAFVRSPERIMTLYSQLVRPPRPVLILYGRPVSGFLYYA